MDTTTILLEDWTHAVLDAATGDLVGVARDLVHMDYGILADTWFFYEDCEEVRFLDQYETVLLTRADHTVRDRVLWALADHHSVFA